METSTTDIIILIVLALITYLQAILIRMMKIILGAVQNEKQKECSRNNDHRGL